MIECPNCVRLNTEEDEVYCCRGPGHTNLGVLRHATEGAIVVVRPGETWVIRDTNILPELIALRNKYYPLAQKMGLVP